MQPDDRISTRFQLKQEQLKGLKKLEIETLRDLLYHFPARYGDIAKVTTIDQLTADEHQQIYGRVRSMETKKSFRGNIPMAEAVVEDDTSSVKSVWFHQPYIAKTIKEGSLVRVEGTPKEKNSRLSFVNPEIESVTKIPAGVGNNLFEDDIEVYAQPAYPEASGISSLWIYHSVKRVLREGVHTLLEDPIPPELLKRYNLPDLQTALVWIHTPRKKAHAESARKRFAFQEIFFIQLAKQQARSEYEKHPSFRIDWSYDDLEHFISRFPFEPTGAQQRAIYQILADFHGEHAMSRLLEGDVGSGKTFVAAATAYAVVHTRPNNTQNFGNLQVGYMAPTEVLARQHFESFQEMFAGTGISIGLITSSGCRKFPSKTDPNESTRVSRTQLLKWVANGEIPILIGTHSLIQDSVEFENLGYVIVDEQHRFGTKQRARLRKKDDIMPHLLSMTATPIPRTLALTIYGDLDISLLDEQPAGRKQVKTSVVSDDQRDDTYNAIRQELEAGRQAYVIVPRIDPPDPANENAVEGAAVTDMQPYLQKDAFPEYTVEGLHSKMTPKEKNAIMERFANGEIDVLVSTSVVEVGVNVPNATAMIIENAERFGLAQLHQFRGRIMRSTHQPYCYVFTQGSARKTNERLRALTKAANGFELAEYDLAQRGAGELAGGRQSGVSDLGMEAIKNIKMVEAAREEAQMLMSSDPSLADHPHLQKHAQAYEYDVHFE